jgi:transposase InsO family protein
VFKLHGLPDTIVLDREHQFISEFWNDVCEWLGIERRLSTAFNPQMHSQTEWMNAIMEQYLTAFVNYQRDDWVKWLKMMKFVAHNHDLETTEHSPFFGNYGFHRKMIFC